MKFEQVPQQVTVEKKDILDQEWFDRFKEIGSFQAYEYLVGNGKVRAEQKRRFLDGEVENPHLDYPKLDRADLERREGLLLELKRDILERERNDIVRQIYRWRINEKIAELRMLQATCDGDDRRFFRYSRFIYGEPSAEIFRYTLADLKERISRQRDNANDGMRRKMASDLYDELELSAVNTDKISTLKIAPLVDYGKEREKIDCYELREMFQDALSFRRLENWRVEIRNSAVSSVISVNQEKKVIFIPHTRRMHRVEAHALIAHEIDTHIMRRETGARSSLRLLELGLDRYEGGEEGVATMRQQRIEGTEKSQNAYAGFIGHLAISLAMGMDGKKRNFRQVFDIIKRYHQVMGKEKEDAERLAWNTTVRTFRGTTCQTPGACFTKDIIYREGNARVWSLVHENSGEVRRFSVGKYDPTNPRHVWVLDQLEITDRVLAQMES